MLTQSMDQLQLVESNLNDLSSECFDSCLACKKTCLETVVYCSQLGGEMGELPQLHLLLDCATLCEPTAYLIARNSDFESELCSICAQLCERGAAGCLRFAEDAQLQNCAEACRRCAESCDRLAERTALVVA